MSQITEIGLFVSAGLLIVAGAVLLFLGTIDFTQAMLFVGAACSILGVNGALKMPSPTQQDQISQVLNMLPVFASLLHSHVVPPQPAPAPQPAAPAAQPKPVVQPAQSPVQAPSDPFSNSALMKTVNPPKQ